MGQRLGNTKALQGATREKLHKLLRQKRPRLSYRQIAEQSGKSEGTVRWYSYQLQLAGEDMTRPRSGDWGSPPGVRHEFKRRPGVKPSDRPWKRGKKFSKATLGLPL